jgi:hypothetical protein
MDVEGTNGCCPYVKVGQEVEPGRRDPIQGGGAQHVRHPVVEHPAVLPQETHGRQEVHGASGFSKTCSNSKPNLGNTVESFSD